MEHPKSKPLNFLSGYVFWQSAVQPGIGIDYQLCDGLLFLPEYCIVLENVMGATMKSVTSIASINMLQKHIRIALQQFLISYFALCALSWDQQGLIWSVRLNK